MINNSMLIQITLLAWIFLGENVSLIGVIGLIISVIGLFLVNWQTGEKKSLISRSRLSLQGHFFRGGLHGCVVFVFGLHFFNKWW